MSPFGKKYIGAGRAKPKNSRVSLKQKNQLILPAFGTTFLDVYPKTFCEHQFRQY